MMDEHKKQTNWKYWSTIFILLWVLILAWGSIWNRQNKIRKLENELNGARADLAEVRGELFDNQKNLKYFRAYSFKFVMNIIIAKAKEYAIPLNVAMALAQIESAFDPFAISFTDDHGLYEINGRFWAFDKSKIYEPEYNINLAFKILARCRQQAGSWAMALAIYNAGSNYEKSDHPRKLSESKFME